MMLGLAVVSLLVAGVVTLGACDWDELAAGDRNSNDVRLLDWKRGTYEGVRLGDSAGRLIRVLGKPRRRGGDEPIEPIGEDLYDIGGLTNYRSPDIGARFGFEAFRYRRRVFNVDGGRVTGWGTTDQRAQTPEGVGVGDSRELVERRYADADCFIQNEGTEYTSYPVCKVRICNGRLLGFGGEPIKSLWLVAETIGALETCRN
jgi:hypothetical protein